MDELFLTPEHLRFKEEVRAFAQKEIAPRAVELDRAGPKSFTYELMRRKPDPSDGNCLQHLPRLDM